MIKQASRLTRNGIPVFPCNADKSPATQHGFKDASIHVDDFRWHAGSLIGVPTGILFDVLDIDLYHDDAKEWYQQHRHELPLTRIIIPDQVDYIFSLVLTRVFQIRLPSWVRTSIREQKVGISSGGRAMAVR